jgi:hypothetical protein
MCQCDAWRRSDRSQAVLIGTAEVRAAQSYRESVALNCILQRARREAFPKQSNPVAETTVHSKSEARLLGQKS